MRNEEKLTTPILDTDKPKNPESSNGGGRNSVLHAEDVTIHYWVERDRKPFCAVAGMSLDIAPGEFVVIVGPSGCGKTTFLDAVGGLTQISSGKLELEGKPITGPGPDRAIVFQQASLFPWRTVKANVAYGLQIAGKLPRHEIDRIAQEHIELVGLAGFEHRFPGELSGGMQQRANLARALSADPRMLLLDEPFGALDAQTRDSMQTELMRIWSVSRKTALFITHDINEAVYLADRVVVMSARPGEIAEIIDINLPRPREASIRRDARFTEYANQVHASLDKAKG
jgi:NitT/TauT family transport system ATP-binding protein